jgi:hypothetical protein
LTDFHHEILLVDLDKDYISRLERKDELNILKSGNPDLVHSMGFDLFQQALHNLKLDIEMWKASSGIFMTLDVKNELVQDRDSVYKDYGNISRTHTRVMGIISKPEDLAWFKLQFGDFKPSTKLVHFQSRGWQFEWA